MKAMVALSVALMALGAAASQARGRDSVRAHPVDAGCMQTAGSLKNKERLENGIRNQVRFLGEPEHLDSIRDKMVQYKIPALSLALIEHGHIAWTETYRNAHVPRAQHLDCTSIFQAASLSKPVTFLAAVRMATAGRIDLDRNIQRYLKHYTLPGGRQTSDHPVTLRNLFAHTSGITPGGYEGYPRGRPLPSLTDILKGAPGVHSPAIAVVNTPGRTLAYSGGGYTLAALALEDIFDDTFANIMNKWVLGPVGMTHSDFTQPLPSSKRKNAARGYTRDGKMLAGGWHNYPEQSAAGLWSNASDLARFLVEIYKGYQGQSSVFSPSAIKAFLRQERNRSAYGFIVDRSHDSVSITHYGGNAGYRTGMTINLTTGNGLVYLTDSDNGGALGNELLLSASSVYGWRHFRQTDVHRRPVKAGVLKGLAGTYRWNGTIDLPVRFDEKTNQLSLHFPNGDAYALVPVAGDELDFIDPNTGVRVNFLKQSGFRSFRLYGHAAVKLE